MNENNYNTDTETTESCSFGEGVMYLLALVALAIGAIILIVGAIKLVAHILFQLAGTLLLGLLLAIVLIPLCL